MTDVRARALYAEAPALTPFSRKPIPYDQARAAGINSWVRAWRAACDEEGEQ